MATSSAQQPEQHVDGAGYSLSAKTTESSVSAVAKAGQENADDAAGSAGAEASTAFGEDGASLISEARSSSSGFRLGSFVTVGSVRSSASATARSGQPVERATELSVDGLSLLGSPVSVTPQGLVASGQTLPVSIDSILAQLASSGVTVRVLAPVEMPDGVTAGALEISYKVTASTPGTPEVVTKVVFGHAMARASASGPAASPAAGGTATAPNVGPTAPIAVTGSGNAVATPSAATSAPKAPLVSPRPAAVFAASLQPLSIWGIYLVVVVAAIAVVGCAQLVRLFGVKLWIS
jgi:hypothetical protein